MPACQTFRVFVSSTFEDLKAERNKLHESVFPRLRELCKRRGARFQAIDLRWGVSEEASLDQQTMNICLGEIKRCQAVTPRPNFLVLLGDRYGWRPPSPQINASEFEELLKHVSNEQREVLRWDEKQSADSKGWYRRDDNAIPPEYRLQPRHIDLSGCQTKDERVAAVRVEAAEWGRIEADLRGSLAKAVEQLPLSAETRFKYEASATEQEISAGAMQVSNPQEKVFCFFRSIAGLPQVFSLEDFLQLINRRCEERGWPVSPRARTCLAMLQRLPSDTSAREVYDRIAGERAEEQEKTEQVVNIALIEGWFRDFIAHVYRDLDEDWKPDAVAKGRLNYLKDQLKQLIPENYWEYEEQWTEEGTTTDYIGTLSEDLDECLRILDSPDAPVTLCTQVWRQFARAILGEIDAPMELDGQEERFQIFPDVKLDNDGQAHCEFANQLLRFFVGRSEFLQQIREYISDDERRPLVIIAKDGTGKSTLIAKALQEAKESNPDAVIVYRFIGATPTSSAGNTFLASICKEISRRYGDEEEVPEIYNELSLVLGKQIAQATSDMPLILFLDGIDQIDETHHPGGFAWLPDVLPEYVRVVISSRPIDTLEQLRRKRARRIELGPMSLDEGAKLLNLWLAAAHRTLTYQQRHELLEKFDHKQSARCPLYLRIAFEEARLWTSYTLPSPLQPGIEEIIRKNLFIRLEEQKNHGRTLVSRILGYIGLSRYGLAEDELIDVMSRDTELYMSFLKDTRYLPPDLVRCTVTYRQSQAMERLEDDDSMSRNELKATENWLDSLRAEEAKHGELERLLAEVLSRGDGPRLPFILWSRLFFDLEPYLMERSVQDGVFLTFYHRELKHLATEIYASGQEEFDLHRSLGNYFQSKADPACDRSWTGNDTRGLAELAYHFAWAKDNRIQIEAVLSDFNFAYAKITALGPQRLIEDFEEAQRAGFDDEWVSLAGKTLQLCSHILAANPEQLPIQLLGRVPKPAFGGLKKLLSQADQWSIGPWLRPRSANLITPRGPLLRTLMAHRGAVMAIAITKDNRYAISGSADNTLKIWDLENWEEVVTLKGHSDGVLTVATTWDGKYAISGAEDSSIIIWDLENKIKVRSFRIPQKNVFDQEVFAVAVIPSWECSHAISGDTDCDVKVWSWDLEHDIKVGSLKGHSDWVRAVAVTPDGYYGLSGSDDKTVRIWDLNRGAETGRFTGHSSSVLSLTLTSDGRYVISGSKDGTIKVWKLKHHKDRWRRHWLWSRSRELATLQGHTRGVQALATISGDLFVSGSADRTLRLWSLKNFEQIRILGILPGTVNAVAATSNGERVITGSSDGAIKVWQLDEDITSIDRDRHESTVWALASSSRLVVSASADGSLGIWDLHRGKHLRRLVNHGGTVLDVQVTPDGRFCVSGSTDKTVRIWNLETGSMKRKFIGHSDFVSAVVITRDGRNIISGSLDGSLKLWKLRLGLGWMPTLPDIMSVDLAVNLGPICALALTPDGRFLLVGSADGRLAVWDLIKGERARTLLRGIGGVLALAVSPNGRWAVSGHENWTLKIWDLKNWSKVGTILGHRGTVRSVAMTQDSRYLVSGSEDETLRIWDLRTYKSVATFVADSGVFACVASQDGLIVAGENLGSVHFLQAENLPLTEPTAPIGLAEIRKSGPHVFVPEARARFSPHEWSLLEDFPRDLFAFITFGPRSQRDEHGNDGLFDPEELDHFNRMLIGKSALESPLFCELLCNLPEAELKQADILDSKRILQIIALLRIKLSEEEVNKFQASVKTWTDAVASALSGRSYVSGKWTRHEKNSRALRALFNPRFFVDQPIEQIEKLAAAFNVPEREPPRLADFLSSGTSDWRRQCDPKRKR